MQWLIDIILERIMQRFSGVVQMWTGTIANIPEGALLCDGTNGTPDLREKFVLGAPDLTEPGTTGGSDTHLHHVDGSTCSYSPALTAGFCFGGCVLGGPHQHCLDLNTLCADSRPKFYEVLYIMWA